MALRLLFRCGHEGKHREGQEPMCGQCGTRGIARVLNAPAPRFVGVATGPHVKTQAMDPATPTLRESPLTLRQETTDV